LKFLFLISHGIYLRNYGGLIESLTSEGHEVVLGKTASKVVDDSALDRVSRARSAIAVRGGRSRNWAELSKSAKSTRLTATVSALTREQVRFRRRRFKFHALGRGRVWRADPPARNGWWWQVADPLRVMRDYLRYLEPVFADAPKLSERAARPIPRWARTIFEGSGLSRLGWVRRSLGATLAHIERAIPPDPALRDYIVGHRPDVVLITPLVDFDYYQLDALKAAMTLGIPTALLVASWDNLTSKGLIQIVPHLVTVWNQLQLREARDMHSVPVERIATTGAQLFDQWFWMKPNLDRAGFCAEVGGLDPARPIVLYLCSSPFVCPDEVSVVRRWVSLIRCSGDEVVRTANVLVRPHPANAEQWREVALEDGGPLAIWPRSGAVPIAENHKHAYFDSLYHSAAVVGVNTSGFLEAAILGRRTLVLQTPDLAGTQEGTLHFRYLVEGGLLLRAVDPARHIHDLGSILRAGEREDAELKGFVQSFLRPHGLAQPCLPYLVQALSRLAAKGPQEPLTQPRAAWVVRAVLAPVGALVGPLYRARLRRRPLRQRSSPADRRLDVPRSDAV
jgi:hypothetical protein